MITCKDEEHQEDDYYCSCPEFNIKNGQMVYGYALTPLDFCFEFMIDVVDDGSSDYVFCKKLLEKMGCCCSDKMQLMWVPDFSNWDSSNGEFYVCCKCCNNGTTYILSLHSIIADVDKHAFGGEYCEIYFDDDSEAFLEGSVTYRTHRTIERNKKLVRLKKQSVEKLTCECCGFDFESTYGEQGRGYIECHHKYPLSLLTDESATKPEDLALVCANCHRMIHRRDPILSIEEVKSLLNGTDVVRG